MLVKNKGKMRMERQRVRRLGNIPDSMGMNLSKLQETEEPGMLQSVWLQSVRQKWANEQQPFSYY